MEFEEVDILSVKFLCSRGCVVASSVNPDITCKFPEGAVTIGDKSFCRVSVQVLNIDEAVVQEHMGKNAAVTPVVMLEPMRRRFHKPITLTIPLPGGKNKKTDRKNIRVLFSITGSKDQSDWQDITSVTCIRGMESGKVTLDTVVTGRIVIVVCDNSIMDIPETMSEMLKSCLNGGTIGAVISALGDEICTFPKVTWDSQLDNATVHVHTQSTSQPNLDLLKAAKTGDITALKTCLQADGVNVNYQNKGGQTALHLACKEGDVDVVEELLAHNADCKLLTQKGNAAIHLASYYGNTEVVQLLLDNGCDANFSPKDRICPLYPAILESQCATVKLLLQRGGDMAWASQDGLPLPIIAVFSTYDKDKTTAMLELLLQELDFTQFSLSPELKTRGFQNFCEALLYSVSTRQAAGEMIGPVRQRLANLSTEVLQDDLACVQTCRDDLKLFLSVIKDGDKEKCCEILSKDKSVNLATKTNISGLHCACLHGHADIVAKLIEAGINVNLQSNGGFTALYLAAIGGNTDAVNCLLKGGVNTSLVNKYGLKASDIAKEMGHIDTLSAIQDFEKDNPVRTNENGSCKPAQNVDKEIEIDKEEEAMKKGCCAF